MFGCGADLIYRVKKTVEQRTEIRLATRGKKPIRNDPLLRRLVDEATRANGHVSDTELSSLLGTSRSTVNNIRHDLDYKYKALRHGPVLSERQVQARLAFCRDHVDQDWTAVMFSDESLVSTCSDSPVMWLVERGTTSTSRRKGFLFHHGVERHRRDAKNAADSMPADAQRGGLCPDLEQHGIHTFISECRENSLFQLDGVRCHTAVSTMRWFHDNGVEVLLN